MFFPPETRLIWPYLKEETFGQLFSPSRRGSFAAGESKQIANFYPMSLPHLRVYSRQPETFLYQPCAPPLLLKTAFIFTVFMRQLVRLRCSVVRRTTGAPQNHWFGPAGDPRAAGIGTIEAIRMVWSCHRCATRVPAVVFCRTAPRAACVTIWMACVFSCFFSIPFWLPAPLSFSHLLVPVLEVKYA